MAWTLFHISVYGLWINQTWQLSNSTYAFVIHETYVIVHHSFKLVGWYPLFDAKRQHWGYPVDIILCVELPRWGNNLVKNIHMKITFIFIQIQNSQQQDAWYNDLNQTLFIEINQISQRLLAVDNHAVDIRSTPLGLYLELQHARSDICIISIAFIIVCITA